jgi:hypothetical protein
MRRNSMNDVSIFQRRGTSKRWRIGGQPSPVPPGIYRFGANPEGDHRTRKRRARASAFPSVLATESALELRPRRALSSAQSNVILPSQNS